LALWGHLLAHFGLQKDALGTSCGPFGGAQGPREVNLASKSMLLGRPANPLGGHRAPERSTWGPWGDFGHPNDPKLMPIWTKPGRILCDFPTMLVTKSRPSKDSRSWSQLAPQWPPGPPWTRFLTGVGPFGPNLVSFWSPTWVEIL
jgi:hypothetical protein